MMTIPPRFTARLTAAIGRVLGLRHRTSMDDRLDAELGFHLDMLTEKNQRLGLSSTEARRAAQLTFGARERFREEARDQYRSRPLEELWRDVKFSARVLRRSPAFTTAVVVTLTVGLGALITTFAVFSSVLLRPLPYGDPERIVQIWSGRGSRVHGPISPANFLDLHARARSFSAMAAEDFAWLNLITSDGAPAERLRAALVTGEFFSAIGVRPALGRALSGASAAGREVVLGDGVWRRQFNADRSVIGRQIALSGAQYTVIGVMPAGFDFPAALIREDIDLWAALEWAPGMADRGIRELGMTGRLKDGVSLAQAQAELDVVAQGLASEYPDLNKDMVIRAVQLHDELVGSSRRLLGVLLGAVVLVLLIACSNVANLTLARGYVRETELQLRTALGARRSRIVRQLLTENVLLALMGGGLALLVALFLTRVLVALAPQGIPRATEIAIDGGVVMFAVAIALLTGFLFGSVPALSASAGRLRAAIGGVGRSMTEGPQRRRLRDAIVVSQVALAFILLAGAGLLLRSFQRLSGESPGFDASGVMTAQVSLDPQKYDTDALRARYLNEGIASLTTLPGVEHVGAVNYLPFGRGDAYLDISIEGRPRATPDEQVAAHLRRVTGDYFATMRIGLLAGRTFGGTDAIGAPRVAVINRAMGLRYWPDVPPPELIGRRVRVGSDEPATDWLTIVGVVGDIKHWSLNEEYQPELYTAQSQEPSLALTFVLRGYGHGVVPPQAVRRALIDIDPAQPISIAPLETFVSASVATPRFRVLLFGFFAVVALLLAVVGIYGVIAYRVSQRTREFGVRLALGAKRSDVVALVVREGLAMTAIGAAVGLAGSILVTRLLEGMLYRISPTDPVSFAVTAAVIFGTALLANLIPARRAARVDPSGSMRAL